MRRRSEAAPRPPFVNAYFDRGDVVFVAREPDGIRRHRVRARTTCFLAASDVDTVLLRMLSSANEVSAFAREGDWYRVVWRDRDFALDAMRAFHDRGIPTFEGTISPIRRIVADQRIEIARPRRVYLDIETDSRVPPAHAREGEARVLCWALVDEEGNEFFDVLDDDTDAAEARLLYELWATLADYDQVIAWYGDGFDFPVIQLRAKQARLDIEDERRRILWLDQLEVFRRMNAMAAKSGDEKQSLALQSVSMALLGEGKNEFDSSKTWQAWQAGGRLRKQLVSYCRQDTRLLPKIEAKTGYIALLQTLCEVTGVFPDTRGLNPGSQVENYLLRIAGERSFHFPTKFDTKRQNEGDQFAGAFVMEPTVRGFAYNVNVADFARLYPSIIMTWNMSPETKVLGASEIAKMKRRGEEKPKIEGAYQGQRVCEASTGTIFTTEKDGILAIALREILRLRETWKNELKKHPPNSQPWIEAYRRSTAYKIAANSFYGVIGSPMSRFFDKDVAEAVTQCGAWLIKETMKEAERRGMSVIYGDTDSLFVVGATSDEFASFVKECNVKLYPRLLRERGCEQNFIELGYEKSFERLVMVTAKRYIGAFSVYEGKPVDPRTTAPEIKGLEFRRGDSTKLARDMQAEVAYLIAGYNCEPADEPGRIVEVIEKWRKRILHEPLSLDEVMISKRLSKPIEGYARKKKADGDWARCPPHVEIAAQLKEQGFDVGEGTRIEFFCIDGVSSPKRYLPASEWKGDCDRYSLWDDLVWPPTKRVVEAAFPAFAWSQWDRTRPKQPRKKSAEKKSPSDQGSLPDCE